MLVHPPHVWSGYAGTLSYTAYGTECQAWTANIPKIKDLIYQSGSMYPSDDNRKTAASNYCRIFDDGYDAVWCYMNKIFIFSRREDCDVHRCGVVPGQRLP